MKWHILLLQDNERHQHAVLPMALLVKKAAHPYIEYDNAGLIKLIRCAIHRGAKFAPRALYVH